MTFFVSDCYSELYGRRPAQLTVIVGFGTAVVIHAMLGLAIATPGSPTGVDPTTFETVLGLSTILGFGSLGVYIVSQSRDVLAFHAIWSWIDGEDFWLRNLGLRGTSQLIDTTIFLLLAVYFAPIILGIAQASPVVGGGATDRRTVGASHSDWASGHRRVRFRRRWSIVRVSGTEEYRR